MAPALAAQLRLASSPPAGGQPRDEAVRDEVMSGAANCIRVAGERPWLDCYYAAALPMRVQLGLAAPSAARAAPAPMPAPRFASAGPQPAPVRTGPPPMPRTAGLFAGMFDDVKPIVRNMPMQSFTMNKDGGFTVTLIDGQVWQQAGEDQIYHPARWRKQASEMLVTIAPAAMHTFNLKVEGESKSYKVRRIK
jgi:hypothetical protein